MKAMRRSTVLLLAALAAALPTSGCGLLLPLVTQLNQPQTASTEDLASARSPVGRSRRPGSSARQAGAGVPDSSAALGANPTSPGGDTTPGEAGGSNLSNETGDATGAGASKGDGGTSGGSADFAGSGNSTVTQPTSGLGGGSGNSGSADREAGGIFMNTGGPPPKAGNALDDYIEDLKKSISTASKNP